MFDMLHEFKNDLYTSKKEDITSTIITFNTIHISIEIMDINV